MALNETLQWWALCSAWELLEAEVTMGLIYTPPPSLLSLGPPDALFAQTQRTWWGCPECRGEPGCDSRTEETRWLTGHGNEFRREAAGSCGFLFKFYYMGTDSGPWTGSVLCVCVWVGVVGWRGWGGEQVFIFTRRKAWLGYSSTERPSRWFHFQRAGGSANLPGVKVGWGGVWEGGVVA